MVLSTAAQWLVFAVFAFVAIAGALGMAATMSMFRSGVFLMASFIGVAGLFVLLSADLLGLLQVMMYVGGMLVMILFMVLFSSDPGGAMMTGHMKLSPLEKLFSRGLAHGQDHGEDGSQHRDDQRGPGHDLQAREHQHGPPGHDLQAREHPGHQDVAHQDMSMFTPIKRPAAALAALTGLLLVTLSLARTAWPIVHELPDPASARRVGTLLMSKYMIAFEGAALLILLGIFGAVFVQRPGSHPAPEHRDVLAAAVDEPPAPIAAGEPGPGLGGEPPREAQVSSAAGARVRARQEAS